MRRLLEKEPDLTIVAEAENGAQAVQMVKEFEPDVVLMDVVMPGLNGIEATKQIKVSNPATAVIILSAYDDDRYVLGLLEAGVAGYLLKHSCGEEVIQAIRSIHAGDAVLHPAVTSKLLLMAARAGAPAPSAEGREPLTNRELDVLRQAAAGLTNKEIAAHLDLSLPTVKAHLVNVFNKTGTGSRTEAVLQALRTGLIHMEDVTDKSLDTGGHEYLEAAEPHGDLREGP
jgi:DNA-binding NarL/FixJ family response regulator